MGGTVSGLQGSGLVLQNNAGDDLAVAADGSFSFATSLAPGADYGVTVKTQPTSLQVCIAQQAYGTVAAAAVSSVSISCTEPGADRFAFTANEGSNNFTEFSILANGQLAFTDLLPAGSTPEHVAVNPSGRNVYFADYGSASITQYAINPAGALTPMADVTANVGTGPRFVGIEPMGRFAYVVGDSGSINRFGIDGTGALVNGAPFGSTGGGAVKLGFDPAGHFVFARDGNAVDAYRIDQSTGDLISPPTSTALPSGNTPTDIAIDPTGRFAYVDTNPSATGALLAYTLNPITGALSLIGSVDTGSSAYGMAIDPTGHFIYVANRNSGNISAFAIDQRTGALTPVPGQPFASGVVPNSVTVDRTGRFAYVASQVDNRIYVYSIDPSTGALTSNVISPVGASGPQFVSLAK